MKRTLSDVIDDLGLGSCQLRLAFIGGGIYGIGGEVLVLFAILPAAIGLELGLSAYERASLGSVVFVGMFLGNCACVANDYVGRRLPLLVAMFGLLVFSYLSAVVYSLQNLLILWGLVGLSYGIGVPAWNALCSETTPTSWRCTLNAISMSTFSFGSLYACLLVYIYSPDMEHVQDHWRTILILGRIPNAIVLVLAIFPGFVESAHFLAAKRSRNAAENELAVMWEQNGQPDVALHYVDDAPRAATSELPLWVLFKRRFLPTTLMVSFTIFMLNLMGFGGMYTLPHVLGEVDLGISPALSIIIVVVCEFLGYVLGCWLEARGGRRQMIMTYLSACIAFQTLFVCGVKVLEADPHSASGRWFVQTGINGTKMFQQLGWIVAYVYVGEAFPTAARASASGFCIGCGRLGALCAPWLFEHLLVVTGTYLWYFVVVILLLLTNMFIAFVFLEETKGIPLSEIEMEIDMFMSHSDCGDKALKEIVHGDA